MSILGDIKMYGRFAWGLRGFLRNTITLEEAQATIRQRLAERETNFLRLVERGIFGYSRSPYLPLMKIAGCQFGDIQHMVRARGLEDTLHALREAGVYITFEEFKGREPIIRDGRVIPVQAQDFDNPYLNRYYYAESGGTTGAGTRVSLDLDYLADEAPNYLVELDAHGLLHVPMAIWRGILPGGRGIHIILHAARFGGLVLRWFSPSMNQDVRGAMKYRLATQGIIVMGRLCGVPIPWPEQVSLDHAAVVAHWAVNTLKTQGACLIRTGVSMALRVSLAAREEGLDLTGASFMGGAEPPTPAKVRAITSSGARWIPHYMISEVGRVGTGCARPMDGNDLHLCKDRVALIQYPSRVPGSEITVNAFYFTTLMLSGPKVVLNVESDDFGVVEERHCGCPLEAYGLKVHLRDVYSFRKLTGEGVTLVGSEMVRILDEVLPSRFGGTPLDYQLMEEEDEKGFTRLSLVISPKVAIADENAVIETVREALKRSSLNADLTRSLWSQAGTLRVKRMEPIPTSRGKLMPLHVAQRAERSPLREKR